MNTFPLSDVYCINFFLNSMILFSSLSDMYIVSWIMTISDMWTFHWWWDCWRRLQLQNSYYMYLSIWIYLNWVNQLQQGNQRWQIPRPATCQCLATFTPLKWKILIFFRDVISLLARVFILLIDTATQEIPMKNIERNCLSSFWDTPLNCYMLNVAHVTNDVKWRPIVTTFGTLIENMSRTGLYDCHIF